MIYIVIVLVDESYFGSEKTHFDDSLNSNRMKLDLI